MESPKSEIRNSKFEIPVAIRCEGLSKQYRIGERESYKALRDVIADAATAPFRRLRAAVGNGNGSSIRNPKSEIRNSFWALDDVSFEVKRGEVVGIIGRNGAGKSTLLKILSRITKPTRGHAEIHGRVGSLLEVGTGFHPELTGRENIYLNAAILGMRKMEVERKFDEIIAFAEVEKFIDTPVKRYSSGMYVRLAFAVAAHLEPEILIVDEVLAVGDIAFQRKCLNKMQGVGLAGRTVLFVSHNIAAVSRLCERVILLDQGKIVCDGRADKVLSHYSRVNFMTSSEREWKDTAEAPGNEIVRLRSIRVRTKDGLSTDTIDIRNPVGIEMVYDVLKAGHVLVPNYHFHNEHGTCAFILHDLSPEWRHRQRPVGRYASTAWIPGDYLAEGSLFITAVMSTYHPTLKMHFSERQVVAFSVVDTMAGDSARGDWGGHMPGVVRPLMNWSTDLVQSF